MRFGSQFGNLCASIVSLDGTTLRWVSECRYLGVYFTSGRSFRCSFSKGKSSFFSAFHAIFGEVRRFATQEAVLNVPSVYPVYCMDWKPVRSLSATSNRLTSHFHANLWNFLVMTCLVLFVSVKYTSTFYRYVKLTSELNSLHAKCCNFVDRVHSNLSTLLSLHGQRVNSLNDMRAVIDLQFFV
jgi:hypothetical protein